MDVFSSPQNILQWFHGYRLKGTSALVQKLHCTDCNCKWRNAAAWCSFPTCILLVLAAFNSPLGWAMALAYCSCMGGPMVFIQAIKPSTRQSDLQQFKEDVEKGRLCPDQYSREMFCSPKCNASCQLCKYCTSIKTATPCNVSMKGMGLEYMRGKLPFK